MRVVFDTNTVVSALLFSTGKLAWIRSNWSQGLSVPLVSQDTVKELLRVLAYPKFKLTPDEKNELLADFLPFCETVHINPNSATSLPVCRDKHDQIFLILAHESKADYLVTGDADLLVLNNETVFSIITPTEFREAFKDRED